MRVRLNIVFALETLPHSLFVEAPGGLEKKVLFKSAAVVSV
jgi:hypothetical protein